MLHLIIIGGVAEWVMGWAVVQGMLGNFDSDEDDGDDEGDEDDGNPMVETKHNVCCKMRGSSVGIHP